jgi:hypothetical protein
MSCCGGKRMALVTNGASTSATPGRPQSSARDSSSPLRTTSSRGPRDVTLRYVGAGSFVTRSVITARAYACAGTGAGLSVDPRDAEMLLRTRLFVRT